MQLICIWKEHNQQAIEGFELSRLNLKALFQVFVFAVESIFREGVLVFLGFIYCLLLAWVCLELCLSPLYLSLALLTTGRVGNGCGWAVLDCKFVGFFVSTWMNNNLPGGVVGRILLLRLKPEETAILTVYTENFSGHTNQCTLMFFGWEMLPYDIFFHVLVNISALLIN